MKIGRRLRLLGITATALVAMVLVCLLVLSIPEPFFPYRVTYKHLTLYSRSELPKSALGILQRTDSLLSRSELYDPKLEARIFVCDSYRLFWIYTLGLSHLFAVCYPDTSHLIFVPKADYEHDRIVFESNGPDDKRERHLTNTLAHEVTHLYQQLPRFRKAMAAA